MNKLLLIIFAAMMYVAPLYAADETTGAIPPEGKVIHVLQDFESHFRPMTSGAVSASMSKETEFGKSCLVVSVPKNFNWTDSRGRQVKNLRLGVLGTSYFPPEADAVRLKVKVVSGKACIKIGTAVSQMGTSDVNTEAGLVDSVKSKEWQTIEMSLNHNLERNFRRANFTKEFPLVYFTRWGQESLYLYLAACDDNESNDKTLVYIDQVELVSKGEGKPFPKFKDTETKHIETIADFEKDDDMKKVCSVAHGRMYTESFKEGYLRKGKGEMRPIPDWIKKSSPFIQQEGIFPAPRFSVIQGNSGKKALQAECFYAEEGPITVVKTHGNAKANAFKVEIKADLPKGMGSVKPLVQDGKKYHVIDFIVLVSPRGTDFPWHDIEATDALKQAFKDSGYKGKGAKFDYWLNPHNSGDSLNVSDIKQAGAWGFYSSRRYVPAKEWTTEIIPFADFICVYGQGECRDMQQKQQLLEPGSIAAIGFLSVYGANHGTITVDELSYVSVPGKPEELRSFWQATDNLK